MILHTLRLTPGTELKSGIESFANEQHILAGFIITCVGGLHRATLRSADIAPREQIIRKFEGPQRGNNFEITSLVGTVSINGLHLTFADSEYRCFGGHLKSAIVNPTAEIVIGEDERMAYTRVPDPATGYEELVVLKRNYPG